MLPAKNKTHVVNASLHYGFTLIEVLIVIMIAGIIAAIAYPSYRSAVTKSKRAEGKAALMQLMQQQERYFSQNTSYVGFSSTSANPDGKKFKWYSADMPSSSAYELSATACQNETIQNCVILTAKPGTVQVNSSYVDEECGNLTFTSTGVKSADGKNCW
jgi:type IV pilus assembly protein PilE